MRKSIYVIAIALLTFVACKNDAKKADTDNSINSTEMIKENDGHSNGDHDHGDSSMDNSSMDEKKDIEATNEKNSETSDIIDGYLQIKNGLVADNKNAAAKGGEILLKAFSEFDMTKLSDTQHKEYMEILENAKEQTEHIVKSPMEHQREHFEVLSNDINDLIALLGTDKTLYLDFCPMYNDGKGAIWLSETEEIKNPYYGSKMMKCGEIRKQIN